MIKLSDVDTVTQFFLYSCYRILKYIIMEKEEKVLTREVVLELGLDKLEVITSDILEGYTSIGRATFKFCSSLTSIILPNSVTSIGCCAFLNCEKMNSIVIGDKTYETQTVIKGKCKAYKAFKGDLICRGFQYEEGKTYEIQRKPELCKQGFHACLNLKDVFNYYYGELGKDIVIHEVKLEGVSRKRNYDDSKVVAKKITIGKRIL